ncbi:MAG TPA: hypothetical protein VK324_00025 [Tepidisphaeraceae bacterium]|nr:hypothetical protein [Tepidisphaeraceae bacterium]
MSTAVAEILEQIRKLPDDERSALFDQLREMRWQASLERLRQEAERRGITDEDIVRAVRKVRYGR